MARFLIDEDLPRSLAAVLRAHGLLADDVRDVGLPGATDDVVLAHARSHGLTVVTGDLGFGSLVRFPLGSHSGIVVARLPNDLPVAAVNDAILTAIRGLADREVRGNLVIVEPGRIRLRRTAPAQGRGGTRRGRRGPPSPRPRPG